MILSFTKTPTKTELIWKGERSGRLPPDVQPRAFDALKLVNRVRSLDEFRKLPGNRFHKLKKERAGQFSISINDQWRICFRWKDGNAYDVEIADYH
jgi:toxin HigB-1